MNKLNRVLSPNIEEGHIFLCFGKYTFFSKRIRYPYFVGFTPANVIENLIRDMKEIARKYFLIMHQPNNSQILTEELVNVVIFEQKAFPEELFRQLFEIAFEYVEAEFLDYNEYLKLQKKVFI